MERPDDNPLLAAPLRVDAQCCDNLAVASKWTKFVSVSMFVMTGLFALIVIAGASFFLKVISANNSASPLTGLNLGVIFGVVVLFALLLIFIYSFLFKFSRRMRNALQSGDSDAFLHAFSSLKIYLIISVIFAAAGMLYNIYLMLLKNGSLN